MNATSERYPVPGTRKGMLKRIAERISRKSMEAFFDIYGKDSASEIEFKAHVDDETVGMRYKGPVHIGKTVGQAPYGVNPDNFEYIRQTDTRLNVRSLQIVHSLRKNHARSEGRIARDPVILIPYRTIGGTHYCNLPEIESLD